MLERVGFEKERVRYKDRSGSVDLVSISHSLCDRIVIEEVPEVHIQGVVLFDKDRSDFILSDAALLRPRDSTVDDVVKSVLVCYGCDGCDCCAHCCYTHANI